MNNKKTLTIEDAKNYVKSREQNFRAKYGKDSLLCLSLTRGVFETEGVLEYRRNFFELVRKYATTDDPVFIGTIDNFLKDGRVERTYGNGKGGRYGKGKYAGV